MAKTKKQSRKDSRGRVLRKGESERKTVLICIVTWMSVKIGRVFMQKHCLN